MSNFPANLPKEFVVVTGGGSGIGKAVCKLLATSQSVVAIGRRSGKLEELRAEFGDAIIPCPMDVSDGMAIHQLRERIQDEGVKISALVNNAGFARSGDLTLPLNDLERNWHEVIATNLTGAFLLTAALVPFIKRPGGSIVFVSSIAAYTGGRSAGSAIYAASKSGLHGLSAGLARELGPQGIRVNTIAPGYIAETEFTAQWPAERSDPIIAETALRRAGRAEDIAETIAYLCSERSSFITGEIINQNGGWRFGS